MMNDINRYAMDVAWLRTAEREWRLWAAVMCVRAGGDVRVTPDEVGEIQLDGLDSYVDVDGAAVLRYRPPGHGPGCPICAENDE